MSSVCIASTTDQMRIMKQKNSSLATQAHGAPDQPLYVIQLNSELNINSKESPGHCLPKTPIISIKSAHKHTLTIYCICTCNLFPGILGEVARRRGQLTGFRSQKQKTDAVTLWPA